MQAAHGRRPEGHETNTVRMKNILKQAENAERLLKLTSDTMLLLNRDGICMDIAVHNVNLWFMKEEKLLGKNLFQLIPPSTYYQVYPEFKKVLTQKVRSVHNYEMTLGHTTYYFKCIMYPYDGMVLCQYRDIRTQPAQTGTRKEKPRAQRNTKGRPHRKLAIRYPDPHILLCRPYGYHVFGRGAAHQYGQLSGTYPS